MSCSQKNVAAALWAVAMISLLPSLAAAVSTETENGCSGTQDDPCVRSGSCEIQGAVWTQDVTIDRADMFDTQGWPGLCDMVHVGLVQGNCDPPGAQTNVIVHLSDTSFSNVPEIIGPLACAGELENPPADLPLGPDVARLMLFLLLGIDGIRRLARTAA